MNKYLMLFSLPNRDTMMLGDNPSRIIPKFAQVPGRTSLHLNGCYISFENPRRTNIQWMRSP